MGLRAATQSHIILTSVDREEYDRSGGRESGSLAESPSSHERWESRPGGIALNAAAASGAIGVARYREQSAISAQADVEARWYRGFSRPGMFQDGFLLPECVSHLDARMLFDILDRRSGCQTAYRARRSE